MDILQQAKTECVNIFGEKAVAYGRAPGRVEVLGNHTDYNEGFILSAAIDRHLVMAGRPNNTEKVRIYSLTFKTGDTFVVNKPEHVEKNGWLNYIQGTVQQLSLAGVKLGGFDAIVAGDVPLGAGLSSSAAIEVATAMFLKQIFPYEMSKVDIALLCQRAENKFVGMNCGILDQFSSVMGKQDHLIFLDCRDLSKFEHIPLGSDFELVLANPLAPHQLVEGAYNRLREGCFAAARHYASRMPGKKITHLRDISREEMEKNAEGLDPNNLNLARHIVGENERVLAGIAALKAGDRETLGRLMLESHASSRDYFRNSCPELDMMVELAAGLPGYHGSRLSGGGFGGCTVNLVDSDKAREFSAQLTKRYKDKTGVEPEMHICCATAGADGGSIA